MPFSYILVCQLLEHCIAQHAQRKDYHDAVRIWFSRHRAALDAHDTDIAALLSTLLPEKRTDRVYCIQVTKLEKIIGRALGLGFSRLQELAAHRQLGSNVDLADCVQRVLSVTPNPVPESGSMVTVEEIDNLLHALAGRIKFSSPDVRAAKAFNGTGSRVELEALYRRLCPLEAKWFTRLLLKTYEPLIFHTDSIFRFCDPALPAALKVLDDFSEAARAVQGIKNRLLPNGSRKTISACRVFDTVKPRTGIKVGRQPWLKGRSIKHCIDMGHGRMSVEEKIDGEYAQIHIDLSKSQSPIQIFSKGGKDSTEDRKKVHSVIMDSVRRRDQSGFAINQQCILEGELVVYSDLDRKILPFHNIRKYVTRRGRFLGTEQDSQPKAHEHLMIVYFDALLIDEESLLSKPHSERVRRLNNIINIIPGRAELAPSQVIDFGQHLAASSLRKAFASVIVKKGEGLVLKPDDPYFDFSSTRRFGSSCIKLKKEYIGSFGDIGDFAAIGAGLDSQKAKTYRTANLKWTHFYLGCLNNKEEVIRWNAKPDFTIVSIVDLNETLLKSLITHANVDAVPATENRHLTLHLAPGLIRKPDLQYVFKNPAVFDLRCFNFDKVGNTGFWTPRFPTVSKVHYDRDFRDTMTFKELQQKAKEANGTPDLDDSQENLAWIARLESADPGGIGVDAVSQLTASTLFTPSPSKRRQSFSERGSPTSPSVTRSQPILGRPAIEDEMPIPQTTLTRTGLAALTPPTSSASRLLSPSAECHKEQSLKRRRLSKSPSPLVNGHKNSLSSGIRDPAAKKRPQAARKPLGDINANANASQPSDTCGATDSGTQESQVKLPEVIDLTHSVTSSHMSTPRRPIDPRRDTCSACETLADAGVSGADRAAHKASLQFEEDAEIRSSVSQEDHFQHNDGCGLVGASCWLANRTLAFAANLAEIPVIESQLRIHGFKATEVAGIGQLLSTTQSSISIQTGVLLFVDSINRLQETRDIVEEVGSALDRNEVEQRDWILVYDYRVLEYVTTMEDKGVKVKSYDGFNDPWARWYIGQI